MLTLMRHGQASFGGTHYDVLSPLGTAQAQAAGRFVRAHGRHFDRLCIGPRVRHRDTATGLVEGWGAQPEHCATSELDEFADSHTLLTAVHALAAADAAPPRGDHVDSQAGPPVADLQRLLRRIGAWAAGDLVLQGGPTLREFRTRVGLWLRSQLHEDQHHGAPGQARGTLAVTSGGVVAAAMCEVLELPDSHFLPLVSQVRNASFTEFMSWRERPMLVSFNGTAHLPAELLTAI